MRRNNPMIRLAWSTLALTFALLSVFGAWCVPAARAQDDPAVFQQLMREKAETVVSIKLLLKIKGARFGPEGHQVEQDTSGLMIDPSGLVLTSSNEMGGVPPALKQVMAQLGEISIEPTNIKVLIGTDPKEYDAEILTRDSELDLAWLRIKNEEGMKFAAQDLTEAADCKLGQKLFTLDRTDKFFDRAPVIEEFRIAGITTKPRHLYVPNTILGSGFCTPIYTDNGKFVGVKILQIPDIDASAANNPLANAAQMGDIQSLMGGFILPAEVIQAATERAKNAPEPESAPTSTPSEDLTPSATE